jgi:hypothetical protein
MNTDAPSQPDSGLDVFTNIFGKINVENILPLGNGLAFLALLLAAILIAMSMIRGKTDSTTSLLIRNFFFVAMFFVVTTIAVDVLRIFVPGPATAGPVVVKISSVPLQEMDEPPFPIEVSYNGEPWTNIFASPLDATLSGGGRTLLMISATVVAGRLPEKTRIISELTKDFEAVTQRSTVAPVIDFTGG